MEINLLDIINIQKPEEFKLHLACRNPVGEEPLDLFIEDKENLKVWNQWRGNKNDWTRNYIFTLINFYPQLDTWLFGGIFKVLEWKEDSYEVEEVQKYKKYSGRLLLNFNRYQGMRGRAFKLENYITDISVTQILEYQYSGQVFPGYENINHDFSTLEPIFKTEKSDWKTALQNVKGVYLITNKENGKMYVGSAYGSSGIWSRWADYIGTLHGWNEQFIRLIDEKGPEYLKTNFKYTILEIFGMWTSDDNIINRENYWKEKLMTRIHGYNKN